MTGSSVVAHPASAATPAAAKIDGTKAATRTRRGRWVCMRRGDDNQKRGGRGGRTRAVADMHPGSFPGIVRACSYSLKRRRADADPDARQISEERMADQPGEAPKLIIDSDWKSQAQAEKERLDAKAAEAGKKSQVPQELKFDDLVGLLASQAMSYMGYFPDPQTGKAMVALDYAKLHIDLLGVLEEKTKNNLSPEEQESLGKTLMQLREDFVHLTKAVAKAVQEGKMKPMGGGGIGGVGGAGAGGVGGGVIAP
ncbi:MAG: DUF1844 domain-containing protein [Tepidisphaera sp.]|nr:DUF1844 domain-containing protein [Tepidisphaera sp.]